MEKLEVNLMGDQKELSVRTGQAPDIFVYKGFTHETTTTDSFVSALKRFGTQENTVMAADGDRIHAIVDCTVEGRPQDTIKQKWAPSAEALRWKDVIGKKMIQAQFVKFLERETRLNSLPVLELLLAQLKTLKVNTQIIGDYSMDDRNNFTFMYKTGELEGTTKIPALIQIPMPLIDDGRIETVDIEIEFYPPQNAGDKPQFAMICPTWADLVQESVDFEVEQIRKALPGWLLLNGRL